MLALDIFFEKTKLIGPIGDIHPATTPVEDLILFPSSKEES